MANRLTEVWNRFRLQAPLAPVAIAFSLGIFLAESGDLPAWLSLGSACFWIGLALAFRAGRTCFLLSALVCLGYSWRANASRIAPDGLFFLAGDDPVPVRVQGVVVDGPWLLDAFPGQAKAHRQGESAQRAECVVQAHKVWSNDAWHAVSGRMRVTREGNAEGLLPGNRVELLGHLKAIPQPMNPGEVDLRQFALRQGIQAELRLAGTPASAEQPGDVKVLRGRSWRPECWFAAVRQWGSERLRQSVSPDVAELAAALVLGDTRQVDRADWLLFQRTGVIHVLAISGQHLVLVAGALYAMGRALGFRTRQMVVAVALLVLIYALVTGGRPPALRAAITVLSVAAAWLARRPAALVNCLALSWLAVAILMPTDLSSTGCLLSFFATGLLHWSTRDWWWVQTEEEEAYQRAVDLSRPAWVRWALGPVRSLAEMYRINATVWLGLTPLVAARTHLVSVVALLVGPPVAILGGWALGTGFLLLLAGPDLPVLSPVLGQITTLALRGCRWLALGGQLLPGAWFATPGPTVLWLALYHALLLTGLLGLWRLVRWQWLAGLAVLLVLVPMVPWTDGFRPVPMGWRCAFLAVGHGSCVVLELNDPVLGRRVLVVDIGAVSGEAITRRVVEPYLLYRGIRKVDDLILSHADMDHYAGALELADRTRVDRVWVGPGFSDKENDSTRWLMDGLASRKLVPGSLSQGDALVHGSNVVRVLHPPSDLPPVSPGLSNEASLVLRVENDHGSLLLPGDLEGLGTTRLLSQPLAPVDVLLAPHHGSRAALTPRLLAVTVPKLLIAQQGPRDAQVPAGQWTAWSTREKGAVVVECDPSSCRAGTFFTGEKFEWLAK